MPRRCSEYASACRAGYRIGASQKPTRPCASRCASQPRIHALSSGSPKSAGSARVACAASGHVITTASAVKPATARATSAGIFLLPFNTRSDTLMVTANRGHDGGRAMPSVRALISRLLAVIDPRRRRRLDADLDAELAVHLDHLTEDHIRRGLSRAEAQLAARRDLGGILQMKEA